MLVAPSEDGQVLLDALLDAPIAWQSPRELARATGFDLEHATDIVANLDAAGWVTAWDREVDLVVTLTPLAAELLHVRLIEVGRDEVPRWARSDRPDPRLPRHSDDTNGWRPSRIDLVVDCRPSALDAVILSEEAEACAEPLEGRKSPAKDLPRPTVTIGFGGSLWPGPGEGKVGACPVCRSTPLRPSEYCLYCDRWGLDGRLGLEGGLDRRTRQPRPHPRQSPIDALREARKARRRARFQEEAA